EREVAARAVAEGVSGPPARAAQDIELLVVDGKGDPVGDAEVAFYASTRKPGEDTRFIDCHRTGEPFARLVTDGEVRCRTTLHGWCFVDASKDTVGSSGDVEIVPGMAELATGFRLMLVQPVRVVGKVLRADGGPAVGLPVKCRRNGWDQFTVVAAPPPSVTDANGAFEFALVPPGCFVLQAQNASEQIDVRSS